jgi:predicted dehydrogenase
LSERRVRVGVIGAGRFAEQCHIPGVQAHPQGEVVALCARNRERTEALARQFGVPDVHTDYHELLARPDIEAVTVATPDALHMPVALAAIEAGKHVFCDKPLTMNVEEARRLTEAAARSGLVNMVAFTFRYMRALPALRRLLREGAIGTPFQATLQVYWGGLIKPGAPLQWRDQAAHSAAGIWGDGGSHLFDALAYALAPAEAVCAQLMIVQREEGEQPDSVDMATALARLRLPAGFAGALRSTSGGSDEAPGLVDRQPGVVNVVLSASRVSVPRGPVPEFQVTGTRGSLGIPLTRGQHEYLSVLRPGARGWEDLPLPEDATTDQPRALARMMGAFVDAVLRGHADADHDSTFAAGLHTQQALEAGLRSARSGCWEKVANG